MNPSPVSYEVAGALGAFFYGGDGPSHAALTRTFTSCGLQHAVPYDPPEVQPNKMTRVVQTVMAAEGDASVGRSLVERLVLDLRRAGNLNAADDEGRRKLVDLRQSLAKLDWQLTLEGELEPGQGIVVTTAHDRPAIDAQIRRLRRAVDDPGLMLGTAKEMLESTAKYVLEAFGYNDVDRMDYAGLWYNARDRLGIHPKDIGAETPGGKQVRSIMQSMWTIADQVNELRNEQGTGHGYTLPTGVTAPLALLMVREACSVAEFVLACLDGRFGATSDP